MEKIYFMKPIPLYSLVIFPLPEQSKIIKDWKKLLQNHIGWYGSVNSEAHITVIQFDTEILLTLYINQIREFCKLAMAKNVTLNTWDHFDPHTFFISPDETSTDYLNKLIIDLNLFLDFKINQNTVNAHLTIARKLDNEKLKITYKLFMDIKVNLQFRCDAFYLRKFNYTTQQYSDIIEKIPFKTNNFCIKNTLTKYD